MLRKCGKGHLHDHPRECPQCKKDTYHRWYLLKGVQYQREYRKRKMEEHLREKRNAEDSRSVDGGVD